MEVGRELDKLVAEKVMGLELVGHHVPRYSTNIADAWPVFCRFTSRYLGYDDATDTWCCYLDPQRRVMQECRYSARSEDETGAEAICLAALKALGYDVESGAA